MKSKDPESNSFNFNKTFLEAVSINKENNITISSYRQLYKKSINKIPEKCRQFILQEKVLQKIIKHYQKRI